MLSCHFGSSRSGVNKQLRFECSTDSSCRHIAMAKTRLADALTAMDRPENMVLLSERSVSTQGQLWLLYFRAQVLPMMIFSIIQVR